MSIKESVVTAFLARLTAISTIPGLVVARQTDQEVTVYPSLILFEGSSTPDDSFSGVTMYDLEIKIEGWIEAADGAAAGVALSAMEAAVIQKVTLDPTLGGIAFDVIEGAIEREVSFGGSTAIGALMASYLVKFQTKRGDPFTAA